ncbi:hypothetical protein [Gimesia fumaroli]|uniref:Uncharacterized protein n=1 Tax=Gimesia fumaroli TaxID=2527976 RepID=A0A518IB74_9PLAN|nr:hypothetical protein [Gimesia fumaroli]QDV50290.1 hypothetical protein Enr17x_23280 [Gimesia fumaroli]
MRHLAFGRILGLLLAVISLVGAVVFVKASEYFNSQYHQWTTARPLETKIDLSQPGSVTVPFHQTCSVSHGEYMMLECDLGEEQEETLEELFQGLSGSIVIKDQTGEEVVNQSFKVHNPHGTLNREIVLVDLPTFAEGKYQATISVETGVPALADSPQIVYAKYLLCGMEQMPGVLSGIYAFCASVVCLIAGLIVLPNVIKYSIWCEMTSTD